MHDTTPAHELPSTPEHTGPLLEYVTLPNCRDCVRFAELLAAAVPDFPTVEVKEIPADSARGRQLSIEQGILRFPVIALDGKIIAIESIAEDELRERLEHAQGSQPSG